jgi:hypothetical protein
MLLESSVLVVGMTSEKGLAYEQPLLLMLHFCPKSDIMLIGSVIDGDTVFKMACCDPSKKVAAQV